MARNTSGKTILLIYDGHKSHETIELHEMVVQHNIELYCLPAHTSHHLQPLDIGVFGPSNELGKITAHLQWMTLGKGLQGSKL